MHPCLLPMAKPGWLRGLNLDFLMLYEAALQHGKARNPRFYQSTIQHIRG